MITCNDSSGQTRNCASPGTLIVCMLKPTEAALTHISLLSGSEKTQSQIFNKVLAIAWSLQFPPMFTNLTPD